MGEFDDLTRPDLVGPLLAGILGDERWRDPEVRLISGGKSNLTFELTSAAGRAGAAPPPDRATCCPGAHDMGREARVQRALAGTDVPVRQRRCSDDGRDLLGVPVLRDGEGRRARDPRAGSRTGTPTTPRGPDRVTDALVDTLADLHAVDPDAVGLGDYGRPAGFMERQVRRWPASGEAAELARRRAGDRRAGPPACAAHPDRRAGAAADRARRLPARQLPAGRRPTRAGSTRCWTGSSPRSATRSTDLGTLLFYWREPGEPLRC